MRPGYSVMQHKNYLGCPLHVVVDELISAREAGQRKCIEFNGLWLYSEDVTMDDAYLKVTGMTREEFNSHIFTVLNQRNKNKAYDERMA